MAQKLSQSTLLTNRVLLAILLRHNKSVRRRNLAALLVLPLLAGCTGSRDYFPLEKDRSWTYNVISGLANYVVDVRVTGQVPVGSAQGYRLEGPLGVSRVAWEGDRLITDCMPNTRLSPPLTILAPKAKKPVQWQGFVETMGQSTSAKARLTQEQAKLKIGTQTYDTILAIVNIKAGSKNIELKTWYAPEIGPVLQEQRTGDGKEVAELDVALHYLGSR